MQLGLRPRLRTRPSLYDLVHKQNIDQLSISGAHLATGPDDVDPHRVPLPASPLIAPHRELATPAPPPHITLEAASDDEEEADASIAKMPPVSSAARYRWAVVRRQLTRWRRKLRRSRTGRRRAARSRVSSPSACTHAGG